MEVANSETAMQCFHISSNVIGNLKISYDTNKSIVVWSKYQLFVYKNLNFMNFKKIEPEFEIENVIVANNSLICLDCSGNLNIKTLESFLIYAQNVKCICAFDIVNTQHLACLQFEQNIAKILVYDCNMLDTSTTNKTYTLEMPHEDWMIPGDHNIIVCSYIKAEYSNKVTNIFNIKETDSHYLLVVVSFDKKNVYAILIPMQNISNNTQAQQTRPPNLWVKLYKSFTDINDIKITLSNDICIVVGLTGGNIIKIPLLPKNQKPEVYHLNTTINKFTILGNTIIYTDILTIWKTDNPFSKSDPIFEQFLVKNVRDFCVINNQVICVTFSNLIYTLNISHRSSYMKSPDADNTCDVQMVTNSDYLHEIKETVQKNEELLKKINKESEYLMALSLSKRTDVMEDLIQVTASVFNDYRDIASKSIDLTLTNELVDYYDSESYYLLVNILVSQVQHKLNKLLSEVLGDIKIHITLFEYGILKTTSVQIKEQLTTKNFVIPLKIKNRNIKRMQVHVKIITSIPGKYDENQRLWTILYQKCFYLKAENFINVEFSTNYTLLKEDDTPLDMLIYKRAEQLHSSEYKFRTIDSEIYEWMFYVKLPTNNLHIEDILGLITPLDSVVASSLKRLVIVSNNKNSLEFQINKKLVKLNIEDGNLSVLCSDIMIALDIRNFFSNIIFNSFKEEFRKELIDHKSYTNIENWKRELNSIKNNEMFEEKFATVLTRFLRNVYCTIPI